MVKKIIIFLIAFFTIYTTYVYNITHEPITTISYSVEKVKPDDLTGLWIADHIEADIWKDEIEVFWVDDEKNIRTLYWSGTYEPPKTYGIHVWESIPNKRRIQNSLNASLAKSKKFTYEDKRLYFDMKAMGESQTICLRKCP